MTRTVLIVAAATLLGAPAHAQVKAQVAGGSKPEWNKGIQPINQENYWNAVECGKQGGAQPACVFYDAGFCKNDDFTIALFTPYKMVSYQVWQAVSRKQPAPTPSYADAQRTRVTVGVTPAPGSKNPITAVTIKRGGKTLEPATRSIDETGGRFIFDPAVFAPDMGIQIDFVGRAKTVSCVVDGPVLALMR